MCLEDWFWRESCNYSLQSIGHPWSIYNLFGRECFGFANYEYIPAYSEGSFPKTRRGGNPTAFVEAATAQIS
jgi:hypothetical protein